MGFFDLFKARASNPKSTPAAKPVEAASADASQGDSSAAESSYYPDAPGLLSQAKAMLKEMDLGGAMDTYERLLRRDGDNPHLLLEISSELGQHGHVQQIIESIAPRYDAPRHGPAIGINVIQAYLAAGDVTGATHLISVLRELKKPELEERLAGFDKAVAELNEQQGRRPAVEEEPKPQAPKVNLITISKPMWFYGHEALSDSILPPKGPQARKVVFTQLAMPDVAEAGFRLQHPEEEIARLTRGIPLWLSETLFFCPNYAPVTAVGLVETVGQANAFVVLSSEWTVENIRQMIEGSTEPVDFVFTGALRRKHEDYELTLRLWEVKKFRERKVFTVRWTPATRDAELSKFNEVVRLFMEHLPYPTGQGLAYTPSMTPGSLVEVEAASLSLFLAEKKLLPLQLLAPVVADLALAAPLASQSEAGALAWISFHKRAKALGIVGDQPLPALYQSPLVTQALAGA